jgi:hypothetical protein
MAKRAKTKKLLAFLEADGIQLSAEARKDAKQTVRSHNQVVTLSKQIRKRIKQAGGVTALANGNRDAAIMLAGYAPGTAPYAATVDWDSPNAGVRRVPPGLDTKGQVLHSQIASRAATRDVPYFEAMSAVTGQPDYAKLSDLPSKTLLNEEPDPDRKTQYLAARALAAQAGISWQDARGWVDHLRALGDLQADTGTSTTPWLDTRQLDAPPRPWSDEDWNRDSRRAQAAGVNVDKDMWQAGAENGQDIVGQLADAKRAAAIDAHQQQGAGFLDQARAREDAKRSSAINDELLRRARNEVAARGRQPRPDLPGAQPLPRDMNDPDRVRADLQTLQDRARNGDMT